ncbi:MAG TPA: copper-binding protein [Acidiferrobacterales bacterium]|nr:copper-binding protein [Acidiferrobacterales bacterium]
MKKRYLFLALIAPLATALPSFAEPDMNHSMPGMAAQDNKIEGTVNKVDGANAKVNISHGPIPGLGWPAMTMDFGLKDKADAAKLKPGQRIKFEVEKSGNGYVVKNVTVQQ